MFTIEFDLIEDLMPVVEKRIKELSKQQVEIGMFREQGVHGPSKFHYVDLFKYLSTGNPEKRLPPRNTLFVTTQLVQLSKSPLKKDLNKYLSNLKGAPTMTSEAMLNDVGGFYREKVKKVFGKTPPLAPKAASTQAQSDSPNTPLVETGELRDHVAHRVNDGNIKTS